LKTGFFIFFPIKRLKWYLGEYNIFKKKGKIIAITGGDEQPEKYLISFGGPFEEVLQKEEEKREKG
jgi:hypothetical protein